MLISITVVFVLSLLSLAEWVFNITLFKSIVPQWIPMKTITAICCFFAATAVVIIQIDLPAILRNIFTRVLSIFICLISLSSLYVHLFYIRTGHESSLTLASNFGFFLSEGTRMALFTGPVFLLIGCTLFLLPVDKSKSSGIAHILIIPAFLASYFVTVSYILRVYTVHEASYIPKTLITGIALCGICVAIIFMRPDTWFFRVFTSNSTGGIIAKKLLIPGIILPILIAWLRLTGERSGIFESDEGVVLVTLTYSLCFMVLIWLTARSVNKIDLERRASEKESRESEERLKKAQEIAHLGSWELDIVNNQLSWSDEVYRIFGLKPQVSVATYEAFLDAIHPDDRSRVDAAYSGSLRNGKDTYEVEHRVIRKSNGEIRYVHEKYSHFRDESGKIIKSFGMVHDITERKKSELALQEGEEKYRHLFEGMTEGFALHEIILDKNEKPCDYRFISINPAYEKQTGLKAENITGKKVSEILPAIEKFWIDTFGKVALTGESIDFENYSAELKSYFKVSAFSHKKGHFAVIFDNITDRILAEKELLESKKKLDIALENGSIGIWEWNILTNEIEWDERMENIFGIEPGSFEGNYDAFEEFLVDEDKAHTRKAISKALEFKLPFETIYRIQLKNGDIKYISTKALVNRDSEGNPLRMAGVCIDITEMKKGAEQTLFSLNENLLRSNKELEQFAYVASHDLQEPLRMISSFTQLLSMRYKDKLDQEAQEFIKYAVDGAVRMQSLINDLLQYSRIETKGKPLSVSDMHNVLGQTVNNLSIQIKEKNALITNGELPNILADGGQMIQLFQNLIGNALKFCNTSPRVHISATEEKDHYLFSVKDNGIGIEPQYFNKIFQIFQRLHAKNEYVGTGIGLAICRRIVERHGGKIWVESEPCAGTNFNFTIKK